VVDDSQEPDPSEVLLLKEQQQILLDKIMRLPPQMRKCLLLYCKDYTHKEIAELMKLSEGAVKKHLFDAKKRLFQD
jgi:RNA polymerase sigma factor (sigma-70 family)